VPQAAVFGHRLGAGAADACGLSLHGRQLALRHAWAASVPQQHCEQGIWGRSELSVVPVQEHPHKPAKC